MKRFKFRLEKILELRQSLKEERRGELLVANQALREAEQRLEQLLAAQAQAALAGGAVMAAALVFLNQEYRARLKAEIEAQHVVIAERTELQKEAQARYVEAAREEKALSLLKSKKLQEYQDYVQKEEEKFLDELSTQKGNTLYEGESHD